MAFASFVEMVPMDLMARQDRGARPVRSVRRRSRENLCISI